MKQRQYKYNMDMTRTMTLFACMFFVVLSATAKIGGGQKNNNSTAMATTTTTTSTTAPAMAMASTYSVPQNSNSARTNAGAAATTKKVTVPVAGYVAKCNVEVGYLTIWISPTRPNGALGKVGSHLIKKYKVMYEFAVSDSPAIGDFVTFKYDAATGYASDYSNPSKSGREAAAAVHDDPLGAVIDGVGAIFGGIFR